MTSALVQSNTTQDIQNESFLPCGNIFTVL